MSEFATENSEKRPEATVSFMTATIEASFLLRQLAEPRRADDTVKAMIRRVSRLIGLPQSRTEDLWRQEARLVRAEEMDAIRTAARVRQEEEAAREEFRDFSKFVARLEALEARLSVGSSDPDFHRDQADAMVQARGPSDRSLAGGGE